MYRPTVFLSHSTKGDPDAVAMRHELESELTSRGWEVRVDENGLRGGEDWRNVLYHWIADCAAAIVLISDRALESQWVRREINLLLWRHALGSPLTIVPVMFSPTTNNSSVELRDLKKLQFVPNNGTPQELANAIAKRLPDVSVIPPDSRDSMQHWLAKVMSCLGGVTETSLLRAAAEALDACQDEWHFPSTRDGQHFLAHQLLGQVRTGRMHTAMEHIAVPVSGKLNQLVSLVSPVWVNGEVARTLLPRQGHRTCVTLNSKWPDTAVHYVRRAACCSDSYVKEVVTARAGEDLEGDLLRDCVIAVRKLLYLPDGMPLEDDEVPMGGHVCFLIIDSDNQPLVRVAEVVRKLQERFRWLNTIILCGDADVDQALLRQWRLADAIVLPALDRTEEKLSLRTAERLRSLSREIAS